MLPLLLFLPTGKSLAASGNSVVLSAIYIDGKARKQRLSHDGQTTILPISDEAGLSLYQHWLDQALSGLMAAVAHQRLLLSSIASNRSTCRYGNLQSKERKRLEKCSKIAKTAHAHAKCVSRILHVAPTLRKEDGKIVLTTELKKHVVVGQSRPTEVKKPISGMWRKSGKFCICLRVRNVANAVSTSETNFT